MGGRRGGICPARIFVGADRNGLRTAIPSVAGANGVAEEGLVLRSRPEHVAFRSRIGAATGRKRPGFMRGARRQNNVHGPIDGESRTGFGAGLPAWTA